MRSFRVLAAFAAAMLVSACVPGSGKREIKDASLPPYMVVDDYEIPGSLTGKPGDAEKGRQVAMTGALGNCVMCHIMPIKGTEFRQGNIGPDLNGIAGRMKAGEMRLRIVNPKIVNEATMMPAYYRIDGLHRVAKAREGKAVLTADQVEDLIAYLQTLK